MFYFNSLRRQQSKEWSFPRDVAVEGHVASVTMTVLKEREKCVVSATIEVRVQEKT